ncbi:Golgi membrane exchange factor (Ric1p-Rgp1p) subunit [Malassezia psittaci]|uniref:Golgi membrane exchange factor (Ric1p-Rgp1p) subunit n=1 Tax=Malassezia psittaci TaxID=1821823 RepID=A0AAF0F5X9_9BASI|nr:Golgi membrane exchange factor (Ric1p-Rgp1p) subunit [Malassezia psittaci]
MTSNGGLVVSIEPKQSFVFAGEELECVITFTNTNGPRVVEKTFPAVPRRAVSYAEDSRKGDGSSHVERRNRIAKHSQASRNAVKPEKRHRKFASRSEAWPTPRSQLLLANHPHKRQKSVVEYQMEDLSRAFQLQQVDPNGRMPGDVHADTSLDSSLSTTAQNLTDRSPMPNEYSETRSDRVDTVLRDSLTSWSREQAGSSLARVPYSPLYPDALPDGHEKLIWAFAQFGGTMELDRSLIRPADFDQLRMRLARGEWTPSNPTTPSTPGDRQPRFVGGGELDYDTEVQLDALHLETGECLSDLRAEHTPSVATLAALLFRIPRSPTPTQSSPAMRSPRLHLRSGSTISDMKTKALHSKTLPTYSTPPTILGIDLVLAPGESRSFLFRLRLPADLPPSFHGHAAHFDYYMSVGTNRVQGGTRATAQHSRLLHVPFRVYNHVTPNGTPIVFDWLNPIVSLQPDAIVARSNTKRQRDEIASLVQQLQNGDAAAATAMRGDQIDATCLEKAKHLVQTAGKTRLAASLETHEELDPEFAMIPPQRFQRITRQVYATYQESVLDAQQTSIMLTIPSGATPEFSTSGLRLRWTLRVSLLTHSGGGGPPKHLEKVPDSFSAFHTISQRTKSLAAEQKQSKLEIVECSVPITVLPNSVKTQIIPIDMEA